MKIAMLLSNGFRPDPRVLKEATGLSSSGYTITVICWDRMFEFSHEEILACGVKIIRVQNIQSSYGIGAGQLLKLPGFWFEAFRILKKIDPDLVHCHDFDTLPVGLIWGKIHRKPVIYDAHEYYADLIKPRLKGWGGKYLHALIQRSEHLGARLSGAVVTVDGTLGAIYRRYNQRVIVIGHYPSIDFCDQPAAVFTRPIIRLIYTGRLSTDRGLLLYVDVLRSLQSLGVPARLVLAGVFTPAGEEQILRRYIAGHETSIELPGWIPYSRMPEVLKGADIGLVILMPEPRYKAALPVKLFEYMSAGLPVIASDFPMISEIVNRDHCGILVDPLAPPQDTAEIIRQWWLATEIPQQMGAAGHRAVRERYNWETLMNQLSELYQTLLKSSA